MCKALSSLNRYEDAFAVFSSAIDLQPDDATAYRLKAVALTVLHRSTDAIKCLDELIHLEAHNNGAYACKGMALLTLGRIAEAVGALNHRSSLTVSRPKSDCKSARH